MPQTKEKTPRKVDVYKIVTDRIIEALEDEIVPWHQPWTNLGEGGHKNLNSKRSYTGINQLLLQLTPYEQPYWVTWNGAKTLGGSVRKGEKSTLVVFSKKVMVRDRDAEDPDEKRRIYLLRYYRVWNIEQIDGLSDDVIPAPPEEGEVFDSVAAAEQLIKDYAGKFGGPTVKHGGDSAAYSPTTDVAVLPARKQFAEADDYYSVGFHELTHSTGHPTRLDRSLVGQMGSESYSREELIAEIGQAMLCAVAGLTPNYERAAGYIDHWKAKLRDDPHLIVSAAAAAQRAADWIQGEKPTHEED